jgi:hypothetical protein
MFAIGEFKGVEVENRSLEDAIAKGAAHADTLFAYTKTSQRTLHVAFAASLQSVNALLASSSAMCHRASPPAQVDCVTDTTTSKLVYRCQHSPRWHEWGLNGDVII